MAHVRGGVLLHPVALMALTVLVVNDRVGKWQYTGVVTGKASDVAGLVLAPLVLVAIAEWCGRRASVGAAGLAAAVVGAGFAAVKASPDAAAAYSEVLGLLVRADPTDLWCLPALVVPVALVAHQITRMKLVTPAAHAGPVQ